MWQGATGRGVLCSAMAAVCLTTPGPAQAHDIVMAPKGRPKATVLVVHLGSWVQGDATSCLPVARFLAAHGYRAVSIDYTLRDVPRSYRQSERKARRYHAAYAVGESAGGSIASWLAARRFVRAAVDVSGPVDLPRWERTSLPAGFLRGIGLSGRAAWEWSPLRRYSVRSAPLLGVYWDRDPWVPLAQGRAIARRGAKLRVLHGRGHVGHTYFRAALRFIRGR
jgi:acetyl esterase/lipase